MKKIKNKIIICTVLVLMLSVMGCSGKSNKQSEDSKEDSVKNTTESTTTQETTEEIVVPYEDVYIEELNNNKSQISMYNSTMSESDNVNSKICITNLAGDDIPELMYVYYNEAEGKEYLRIIGCDNGVKKVIYDDAIDITPWGDCYYFFKTNDGKLNYYIGYGDNEYHDMYCTFEEKADGKLSVEQRVLMASWMDPMDGNMGYRSTVNDVEISEEEFNAKEESLISNIDVICIYDNFGLTALKGKVASFSDIAMGCEDAIIYLGGTTEEAQ